MAVGGHDMAVERVDDVVHAEDEVLVGGDAGRPLHQIGLLEQRDQVAGADFFCRGVEAGE